MKAGGEHRGNEGKQGYSRGGRKGRGQARRACGSARPLRECEDEEKGAG